jgi:DNA-directed RNA polymerase subunit M/transcription elongation factor TFIIS
VTDETPFSGKEAGVSCPNCEASMYLTKDGKVRKCPNCQYTEPHNEPITRKEYRHG